MAEALTETYAALGPVEAVPIGPSQRVTAAGAVEAVAHPPALRIKVRPEAPLQVALTGHFDTVFPASHPFQTPVLRSDGVLHGPGVADMKGGLVVMAEALSALETLPFKDRIGFEVLLSPDEEIGSPASAPLLADLGRRSHVGMTYEPGLPDGGLVSARKGSAIFALILRGRAAHVGRAFDDGRSAILAGAQAATALGALNGRCEGVTVNVGAIEGGGPVNVVPDTAVVRFNVRVPDDEAATWALAEVDRIVAAISDLDGIAAELTGGFTRPPKPLTPAQEQLVDWTERLAAILGQTVRFAASGGVCEGNNLAAAGCPNIDTLGPCGGALHSEDEFAIASSFGPRAQLSFLMLAAFASGLHDVRELRR
jgi:glutamate carboxypeptidase